ncbi:MAG: hypothetical protein UT29_C0001G0018 [Candidatus Yanofskybacteria bacterium GW2011_GWA1_39_13]|uniref:Uncharacterized protein n=1 Tax=Yanofskybacteria sp. (strain GW2011_GWA1_39_13) TaxID=1619019 RepID=A0A0G0MH80_YANXG|nr:MAG: hypothetical protein UT29_C0001G0018 [Candidatus Yanofskybacteria bacterium GW2011_GWA1_39_13]
MTASTHLAVGAMAGLLVQKYLPNAGKSEKLFFGFAAGFVSHLLLDTFPHQEYSIGGIELGAVLFAEIAFAFSMCLSFRQPLLVNAIIFLGMVGGAMPDVVYFANRHLLSWAQLGDLGSIIHLFSHDAVPLGFDVSIYFQLLLAFGAYCFVKLKLRPVK